MSQYTTPNESVRFGDVFTSAWLHDAYLRDDAVPLAPVAMKGGRTGFAPAEKRRPASSPDLVLAHGSNTHCIVIADDCEIETCLVRSGSRGRRLFFAAIEVGDSQASKALRFLHLPASATDDPVEFAGGVLRLDRLFAVRADSVDPDDRLLSLTPTLRQALEQQWNGFAVRRGPLIHATGVKKMACLLSAAGDSTKLPALLAGHSPLDGAATSAARSTAEAFGIAWDAEGRLLGDIESAFEDGGTGTHEVAALRSRLSDLRDAAEQAIAEIDGALRA